MTTTKKLAFAIPFFCLCSLGGNPIQVLQEKLRALKQSYSEAVTELSRADDALRDARHAVVRAAKDIEQATSKIVDEEKLSKTATKWKRVAQTELRDYAATLRKTIDRVVNDEHLIEQFKKEKDELENKIRAKGEELRKKRSELLEQEVLAYSFHTEGNLSINFRTGAFASLVDFGNGMKLDTEKLQAYMEGSYSIPTGNPVQFAASSASMQQVEHQLNYYENRKDFLKGSAPLSRYFSSERFVNWASSETLAHHIALGIGTAGSSTDESLKEVKDQIYLEFNDIMTFLSQKGEKDLPKVATCVLGQMLGIHCDASVRVKAHSKVISCNLKPRGNGMNELFRKIVMPQAVTLPIIPNSGKHVAFELTIEGPESVEPKRLIEAIAKQEPLEVNLEELFQQAVDKLLPQAEGKALDILKRFDFRKQSDRFRMTDKVRKWVDDLGLSPEEILSHYEPGNMIVDLRDSTAARKLEEWIKKKIAQGNNGNATVQVFEIDLGSATLNMKVDVLHRQSWGTVREALKEIGETGEKYTKSVWAANEKQEQAVQDKVDQLEKELKNFDEQLVRAVGQIAKVENRVRELVKAVEDKEKQLNKMESNARKLIDSVGSADEHLSQLKKNLAVSRRLLKERQALRMAADKLRGDAYARVEELERQIDRVRDQISRAGGVVVKEVQKAINEIAKRIPRLPR